MQSFTRLIERTPQTDVDPCGSINITVEKSGAISIGGGIDKS